MRKILAALAALVTLSASAATLTPVQLLNPVGSTSGQAIVSTGASTAPAWGKVTAAALAAQAANTVVANVTGSSASPTAFAMPSCSTANSALQYTSGTGFTCVTNSALTTGTLAQFAATTSAQLAGVVSDETGSGSLVFGTNPTISGGTINNATVGATTASTGRFTTVVATSTITPSSTAGIVGTTTNDNANAGSVGEFICAQVTNGGSPTGCATNTSTPVSLSANVPTNVTSITLTAGDWDMWGAITELPAGTTTTAYVQGLISATSGGLTAAGPGMGFYLPLSFGAGVGPRLPVGATRITLTTTTTVYLVAQIGFSVSTCAVVGELAARRRR